MNGVEIPDRGEDYAADPVELFFDLVFVFAFSRLVHHLVHHPNWQGVGEFLLLLAMIWLPWTQFTRSMNAVPGNARRVRVVVLAAVVASMPMAASVSSAFDSGGLAFAISLSVITAMALFTIAAGVGDRNERRSAALGGFPNYVAIVLFLAGGLSEDSLRTTLWIAGVATIFLGTLRLQGGPLIVRPAHFAERHGLILIIALGEVIVAIGNPIVSELEGSVGLSARTLAAIVAAGTFAGLLWWSFFDRTLPALEHRHSSEVDIRYRRRFARDVYTYLHPLLIAGVILATAGLEEITLHPDERLTTPFRLMLASGTASYLLGAVAMGFRAYKVVAVERIIGAMAVVALVAATGAVPGLYVLISIDGVLFALLVLEYRRLEVVHRMIAIERSTTTPDR